MDEMKIRTGFLKGIISRIVSSVIKKKLGRKIKVTLNDLQIEIKDKALVHLDLDAEMTKEELEALMRRAYDE